MAEQSIQTNLFNYFKDSENFTLKEANDAVLNFYNQDVKEPSIRARIYEGIDKGLFERVSKGVYTVTKKDEQGNENTCLLINGDGRDLSMIEDGSIDALITDHPYKLDGALKGGNRDFASYDLFKYEQKDFDEKYRVLKPGAFLLEFLPEESEVNYEYLFDVKQMAKQAGFKYFAKVPWKKGTFVANTGRTAKNREDIVFFSKGEPRALKLDAKKNLMTARENGLEVKGLDSYEVRDLLENCKLPVSYMKGTSGMLPTEFDYQPRKKDKVMEAEKPVELFDAILPYITKPGEKILDQFGGSGNIGVSALKNGRDAIIIEKDEKMFEKMKANIEQTLDQIEKMNKDITNKKRDIWNVVKDKRIINEINNEPIDLGVNEVIDKYFSKYKIMKSELEEKITESSCYSSILLDNKILQCEKILNCTEYGDQRFNDAYAMVSINGKTRSIKEIIEDSLKDKEGNPASNWMCVDHVVDPYTGDVFDNKQAGSLYRGLWVSYYEKHPDLIKYASKFDTFLGTQLDQFQDLGNSDILSVMVTNPGRYKEVIKCSDWYKNVLKKHMTKKGNASVDEKIAGVNKNRNTYDGKPRNKVIANGLEK